MKTVIVSGYFNPLHGGHLDMIEAARELGERLIVIVNNDRQQLLKKGKVILSEASRARLMRALRAVDEVVIALDDDSTVIETLRQIATRYPDHALVFANGGDRNSTAEIPESAVAANFGIELVFGVGGASKADSSTRINQATGDEVS